MSSVANSILFPLLLLCFGWLPAPANDAVTFTEKGTVSVFKIPNYTFPGSDLTNCYVLANEQGQAILIDPADQLEFVNGTKFLVDRKTGASKLITDAQLTDYTVVETSRLTPSLVKDVATGQEYLVYDQFRSTGIYARALLDMLKARNLRLEKIIITHGHLDHIAAMTYLKEQTGAEIIMHESDMRGLDGVKLTKVDEKWPTGYAKDAYRIEGITTPVDRAVTDGDLISIDGITLQVLHTPGHSPGSLCLFTRKGTLPMLFSGDTLLHWWYATDIFGERVQDEEGRDITFDTGRTNFLDGSGDEALLYRMIAEKLLVLPEETMVYPGHLESTTIGEEKKYSPARFLLPKADE